MSQSNLEVCKFCILVQRLPILALAADLPKNLDFSLKEMLLFCNVMYIRASRARKDWRNFQQLCRVYTCSVEQRGLWNAALTVNLCWRFPRLLGPGQFCRKEDPECWTGVPNTKAHLQSLEWGSQTAELSAVFGKAETVWEGMNFYFLVRKFLTSLSLKGFDVILFVEWESCRISPFWINPEILRQPGLSLRMKAFAGRPWQAVWLMRNSGQSALCSDSSRLSDDSPGDVFSQSERPYLIEEPKDWRWGVFMPSPHATLLKSSLLNLVRKTLRSWKIKSDCFGEG